MFYYEKKKKDMIDNEYLKLLFLSCDIDDFKKDVDKRFENEIYKKCENLLTFRSKDGIVIEFISTNGMKRFAADFLQYDKRLAERINRNIAKIEENVKPERDRANEAIEIVDTLYKKYNTIPLNQLIELYVSIKNRPIEKEIMRIILDENEVVVCVLTEPITIGTKKAIRKMVGCTESELKNRDAFRYLSSFTEPIMNYKFIGGDNEIQSTKNN